MEIQPLETILRELASDDWLVAGVAIHKLVPHGESATAALPTLFELTMHDRAPVASHTRRQIKWLGEHAVPFLRERAVYGSPNCRAEAIALLSETGGRWATMPRLVEQVLPEREVELPEWGTSTEEIIDLFRSALTDECLSVRFNAASALEEFGRHVEETIAVFIETLDEGNQFQQTRAALQLGRIGPLASAATPALETAAKSDYSYTALAAKKALRSIGRTDAAR